MDRPKWMPEEAVILEIQDGEYIDGEVDDAFRRTGLRAQIEVLEELDDTRWNSWHLSDLRRLIVAKIAALRRELEG